MRCDFFEIDGETWSTGWLLNHWVKLKMKFILLEFFLYFNIIPLIYLIHKLYWPIFFFFHLQIIERK